jgi:hypothetical protein
MPYIKKEDRDFIDAGLAVVTGRINSVGELNYAFSQMILAYIKSHGGVSYRTMNDVHGVLSCLDKEVYRRITAPYEDQKVKENGDVF